MFVFLLLVVFIPRMLSLAVAGWWFVCSETGKEGWFPGTQLEVLPPALFTDMDDVCPNMGLPSKQPNMRFTAMEFEAREQDELSFNKGVRLEVISKSMSGWWTVR